MSKFHEDRFIRLIGSSFWLAGSVWICFKLANNGQSTIFFNFLVSDSALAIFVNKASASASNNTYSSNKNTQESNSNICDNDQRSKNCDNDLRSKTCDMNNTVTFLKELFSKYDLKLRIIFFPSKTLQEHIYFYNKMVCIDSSKAVEIFKNTTAQGNQNWRQERLKRITASDCYSLYTYDQNKNPDWPKKIQNYYKSIPPTAAMRFGKEKESIAINKYADLTGHTVSKMGLVVQPSCPWLGSSPDGFVLDKNIVVEVKTVLNKMKHSLEKAVSHFITKRNVEEKDPLQWCHSSHLKMKEKCKYYAQVQINMILLNAQSCDLVIFDGATSDVTILYVKYNEKFTGQLIRTLLKVYMYHALPFIYENSTTDADKQKLINKTI